MSPWRSSSDEVRAGRYGSQGDGVRIAVERLRHQSLPAPPIGAVLGSIGLMREDAELLDEIVEGAMRIREERPWRLPTAHYQRILRLGYPLVLHDWRV